MKSNSAVAARPDFSYLDESAIESTYSQGQSIKQIIFHAEGIHCAKCLRKIEGLTLKVSGLVDVSVEMGRKLIHAKYDPLIVKPSTIADAINDLGFKVRPVPQPSSADSAVKGEDRSALIRLAVAGALAGNIMAFSTAIYLGGNGPWLSLFAWMSFALYLPVVTFVAWPFYKGAYSSFRQKRISIDLPMAVASLSGFVFSTVQMLRGREDFYFDSMSSFLFLILLARYVQSRLQRRYLDFGAEADELTRVRLVSGNNWKWVPTADLTVGDTFMLEQGETLPVEGSLLSPSAHLSLAWLTGEANPKHFQEGATAPAGAKIISDKTYFAFQKPLPETAFGKTLEDVRKFATTKNRSISTSDLWAQRLLYTVFGLAAAFVLIYWHISPEESVRRALALIVLACPCAMAFGTPLALLTSLKKATKAGILISDANVFEAIQKVKTIFLDKTGTLTDLDVSLQQTLIHLPTVYKKVILSLENRSTHPIAFAFRRQFGDLGKLPPVDAYVETPGVGVSGFVYGKKFSLRRNPQNPGDQLSCALFVEDALAFEFCFEAKLRPGTAEAVEALQKQGFRIRLLSGDSTLATTKLAKQLNISLENVHGDLLPNDKAALVAEAHNSMMIGDGVNDAQALMKADVSIAVAGAVDAALKSSKVYFTSENLSSLMDLLAISQGAHSLIRQNLTLSVVYNITGGVLALSGFINPLVAAILMPVSSGIILLNTWRRESK